MDPASAFFAALEVRDRDPSRYERAIAELRPLLERAALTVAQRSPDLLLAAKTEVEDVVQELTRKLFRDPPTARGRAEAVIVGWAKVVVRHHLLDRAAKLSREAAFERAPDVPLEHDPSRAFDAKRAMRQLEECADELTERYRAAYEIIREDAEVSRLDLARRLELIASDDQNSDRLRKAQANAWAIVSRMRARLAECLDRHGLLELLPDTLSKLRSRGAS
jgi:hypothetical protein